jgi:hypothetical protein
MKKPLSICYPFAHSYLASYVYLASHVWWMQRCNFNHRSMICQVSRKTAISTLDHLRLHMVIAYDVIYFTSCHLMMAISMSCTVDQKKALDELDNDVLKSTINQKGLPKEHLILAPRSGNAHKIAWTIGKPRSCILARQLSKQCCGHCKNGGRELSVSLAGHLQILWRMKLRCKKRLVNSE